jgi:hypothetical protein
VEDGGMTTDTEKKILMEQIRGDERMFTRTVFTHGYQQWVRACSLEEAQKKFEEDHDDVRSEDESFDTEGFSDIYEDDDTAVEEWYG